MLNLLQDPDLLSGRVSLTGQNLLHCKASPQQSVTSFRFFLLLWPLSQDHPLYLFQTISYTQHTPIFIPYTVSSTAPHRCRSHESRNQKCSAESPRRPGTVLIRSRCALRPPPVIKCPLKSVIPWKSLDLVCFEAQSCPRAAPGQP